MTCPSCRSGMGELTLEGHVGRAVSIDLCRNCQVLWFDKYESLQLSARSVLQLFRTIGNAGGPKSPPSAEAKCPRCDRRLHLVHDMQRTTRFEYLGCPDDHGRLINFFNFLREKNFITPLSPAQVEELDRKSKRLNSSHVALSRM